MNQATSGQIFPQTVLVNLSEIFAKMQIITKNWNVPLNFSEIAGFH